MSQTTQEPPGAVAAATLPAESVGQYARAWLIRVRHGDLGSLPIVVGLAVIAIVFGVQDAVFFSERNFTNLMLQMAGITTIAIGVVFVLLIAQIDLSVGFVSAIGGVTMTLLLRPGNPGVHWTLAILAALAVTAVIGLLHGVIITKAGVPSFVVTLAGLLAWSGVVLILTTELSTAGTINLQDPVAIGIANAFLPAAWGWAFALVTVGAFGVTQLLRARSRQASGLASKPLMVAALQVVALTLVVGFAVWYANLDRGVPVVALLLFALLAVWSFVATRTRFGRYVYAVGGNPEAARRAGISVDRIKIAVFMISSTMAGLGGIVLASRLRSVDTNAGGGDLLLNAIAAAVIGGTSLFGGSGRVVSALLGALVIASVDNGMGLLGLPSGVKFVVTGLVLLAAVLVDAFSKRGRAASGMA